MANQIIEQQAEARAVPELAQMQFIVADDWAAAGECCVLPLAMDDEADNQPLPREEDWLWGRCVS